MKLHEHGASSPSWSLANQGEPVGEDGQRGTEVFLYTCDYLKKAAFTYFYFFFNWSLTDLQCYLFLFWLCHVACGLVPQLGIEPRSQDWKRWVLTTGLPGNSRVILFFLIFFIIIFFPCYPIF